MKAGSSAEETPKVRRTTAATRTKVATKSSARGRAASTAERIKQPWGTQSIHRAVTVLRELSSHGAQGTRLVEIAEALELERPTAHRILKGLLAQGMVSRDAATKTYRLGHLVYELGLAASPHFNLKEVCHPTLQRIAEKTQDSVFLMVRSGLDAVCIERLEGSYPIQTRTLDVGGRRPLGCGAGGLALLLELPDDEIERVVAINAPRFPAAGRMTVERMRDAIRKSRKAGYAINDEDMLTGVSAIGVAVKPPSQGRAYVAISVAGIKARFQPKRRDELAQLIQKEARALSRKVGLESSLWE
jgi:DNA-binding IclR family transcriptional regulator